MQRHGNHVLAASAPLPDDVGAPVYLRVRAITGRQRRIVDLAGAIFHVHAISIDTQFELDSNQLQIRRQPEIAYYLLDLRERDHNRTFPQDLLVWHVLRGSPLRPRIYF